MSKMKELFTKQRGEEWEIEQYNRNRHHSLHVKTTEELKQKMEEKDKASAYVQQEITTDDVVEQIAEAVTKLTTAATEQSKLLKLITDEILTLKSKVEKLEK
jgi:ferredoxin-NADP reductase